MFRPLLSAAGQVDEDAGKGVKTENKLANCQVSLACREDTQRGWGWWWEGGGTTRATLLGFRQDSQESVRSTDSVGISGYFRSLVAVQTLDLFIKTSVCQAPSV